MRSLEHLDIDLEHSQLLQEVDEKHNQPPNLARWATIGVVIIFWNKLTSLNLNTAIFHMWTPPEDTVCCSTRPSKVVSFAGHQTDGGFVMAIPLGPCIGGTVRIWNIMPNQQQLLI